MEKFRNELLKVLEEKKNYKNLYLKTLADFKNYKMRQKEEVKKLEEFASEGVIINLLPVIDNFERAMGVEMNDNNIDSIKKGIEMIYKQFMSILEKEGLKPFSCIGEKFDPYKHEAIEVVEDENREEGVVVDEIERGYYYKDKLLRHAKVIISKKPSKKEEKQGGD